MPEDTQHSQLDLYYKLGNIESSVTSLKEYMKAQFENLNNKIEDNQTTTNRELTEQKIKIATLEQRINNLYIKVGVGVGTFSAGFLVFGDYIKGLL